MIDPSQMLDLSIPLPELVLSLVYQTYRTTEHFFLDLPISKSLPNSLPDSCLLTELQFYHMCSPPVVQGRTCTTAQPLSGGHISIIVLEGCGCE